jgi:hypothetical protein
MPDDRDLVAGVAQLANLLNRRLAPVLERAGITPQQWGVLTVIAATPDAMTLRRWPDGSAFRSRT